MPDPKMFTEDEHTAILADRVARETAEAVAERDAAKSEVSDLQSKLDIAEAAKAAAEQERDAAVNELTEFKAEVEGQREAAARKETRVAAAKEAVPHLAEDYWNDEGRLGRILAMEDESFTAYLDDLKATAPTKTTTSTEAPRETAMQGAGASGAGGDTPSAAGTLLLGRFGASAGNGA